MKNVRTGRAKQRTNQGFQPGKETRREKQRTELDRSAWTKKKKSILTSSEGGKNISNKKKTGKTLLAVPRKR